MPALTMKRIAGRLAAMAAAAAIAAAPQAGMAMGGGRGGSNDIGFEAGFQGGAQGARGAGPRGDAHAAGEASPRTSSREARGPMRVHGPGGAFQAGDHFQDERWPGPPDGPLVLDAPAPAFGGVMDRGQIAADPAHADHRLLGPVFDEVRQDWPIALPFGPQMYGARDFPHCMRRDVYGDPYQAC
jgi:hypothetical protein